MKNYFKVSANATWVAMIIYALIVFFTNGHWLPFGQAVVAAGICWLIIMVTFFFVISDESTGASLWIPVFTTITVFLILAMFHFINENPKNYAILRPEFLEKNFCFAYLFVFFLIHVCLIGRLIVNLTAARSKSYPRPNNQEMTITYTEPRLERSRAGVLLGNICLQVMIQFVLFAATDYIVTFIMNH